MLILAYLILAFTFAQFLVALSNLVWNQQPGPSGDGRECLVSVLIPARNEEKNIGSLLDDLLSQDYEEIEIIVFDDQSDDRTAEIVSQFMRSDPRIHLERSQGLPAGWLGKNHACHTLSGLARGKYLLFLDADVRIGKGVIARTVSSSRQQGLGLLSIFPAQIMKTPGEHLTVPNMHYILLTLLPLILVRRSKYPSLSAANGQFMLFESATYQKNRPHEQLKSKKVEDIEIARMYKKNNIAVACLAGVDTVQCRMYGGFREAADGFSKNVFSFFGNSSLLACLFWGVTTFGVIPVFLGLGTLAGLALSLMLVLIRALVSLISRQSVGLNLLLLIPQQLALGWIMAKAFYYSINKHYQWKGRNIQ